MSFYTKVKMVLTIVIAVIISVFTYKYLDQLKQDRIIVIATQDINPHTIIQSDMIEEVKISKRDEHILGENVFSSKEELQNAVSKVKIEKGKSLVRDKDVIAGSKEELINKKVLLENGEINEAYFISDNRRITTVSLDTQGAVNNKIDIGDYVDVIYTYIDGEKSCSYTILKHIEVYDNGNLIENNNSEKNISLVVNQQEAVLITCAKRTGKIDLVLNASNGESQEVGGCNLGNLIKVENSKETNLDKEGNNITQKTNEVKNKSKNNQEKNITQQMSNNNQENINDNQNSNVNQENNLDAQISNNISEENNNHEENNNYEENLVN